MRGITTRAHRLATVKQRIASDNAGKEQRADPKGGDERRHVFEAREVERQKIHLAEAGGVSAEEELQRQLKNRDNVVDVRGRWAKPHNRRKPLVMTLMIISVAVFVLTNGWEFDGEMAYL